MKTIKKNGQATGNNSLTKKNGRKPDANPTGECPAVQNKCWMSCTFYILPNPAFEEIPDQILEYFRNLKNVSMLNITKNDGERMDLDFKTSNKHSSSVLRKLMNAFPEVDIKASICPENNNCYDYVRLVGGQLQQMCYPCYLSTEVTKLIMLEEDETQQKK